MGEMIQLKQPFTNGCFGFQECCNSQDWSTSCKLTQRTQLDYDCRALNGCNHLALIKCPDFSVFKERSLESKAQNGSNKHENQKKGGSYIVFFNHWVEACDQNCQDPKLFWTLAKADLSVFFKRRSGWCIKHHDVKNWPPNDKRNPSPRDDFHLETPKANHL